MQCKWTFCAVSKVKRKQSDNISGGFHLINDVYWIVFVWSLGNGICSSPVCLCHLKLLHGFIWGVGQLHPRIPLSLHPTHVALGPHAQIGTCRNVLVGGMLERFQLKENQKRPPPHLGMDYRPCWWSPAPVSPVKLNPLWIKCVPPPLITNDTDSLIHSSFQPIQCCFSNPYSF